jgi:hypothetical protein
MATKEDMTELRSEMTELRSEMHSLRADVAADLHNLDGKIDTTRKDLSEQIVGLRRAVIEYHSAVIGHGVIISELEAPVGFFAGLTARTRTKRSASNRQAPNTLRSAQVRRISWVRGVGRSEGF